MVYRPTVIQPGILLKSAVVLANLYLLVFGLDAAVSVADEVLKAVAGSTVLEPVRTLIATLAIVLTLPMVLVLFFVPHLPKPILLLPVTFVFWTVFGAPPFGIIGQDGSLMTISVIQLVIAAICFVAVERSHGRWFLRADLLPSKRNHVIRFFAAFPGLLLYLFAVGFVFSIFGLPAEIERQTGGYVSFTRSGIDIRERIFETDGSQVHLIGMIHIGDDSQYRALFESWPGEALVLAEGVTDKNNLLGRDMDSDAGPPGEQVGLVGQPTLRPTLDSQGRPIDDAADGDYGDISAEQLAQLFKVEPDVMYADVDMSDLSPETVAFIKDVTFLFSSRSLPELLRRLMSQEAALSAAETQEVMDEILYVRNDYLMSVFDAQKNKYDLIIIPWGAMHMPDIENRLLEQGYEPVSERRMPLIRFESIFNWAAGVAQSAM